MLSDCFMSVKFEPCDLDGQRWKPAALKAAASRSPAGLGFGRTLKELHMPQIIVVSSFPD